VPLLFPDPPAIFTSFFTAHLSMLAAHYDHYTLGHPIGRAFAPEATEMPHEVFSLSLVKLQKGADVSSATSEGWRLFLQQAPPIRVVEVDRTSNDDSLLFLGITAGPQVDYLRQLLEKLKTERDLGASYTVRLLRVKPLYLSCVWLSGEPPQGGVFLTLPPVFSPFSPDARYKNEEMTHLLQDAALQQAPNTKVLFAE
jgi:hypothetical protein